MAFLTINEENDFSNFCKYKIKNDNVLVGMPLIIDYATSVLDSPLKINAFYGINPKENYDITGMILYILDKGLTQEEKQSIQDAFKIIKTNTDEKIKESQPNFFDKINKICYEINNINKQDINKIIIQSLTNKNEQPLLLAGLSGYGKTASFSYLIENIKTKSINELQDIYNISEEKAKQIKNFTSTGFVNIDEESKKNRLMGNYSLEETNNGVVTILENGALGSLIKDCYYAHRQTLVVFDEILDSPEIMTAMKSSLMPKDGNYYFTPSNSREFILIEANIINEKVKSDFAFFEVAQKSDNLYSCDDKALKITKECITIDSNKLTSIEQTMLHNSIYQCQYDKNNIANVKRGFLTHQMSSLDRGYKILLISKDKAAEIKENFECKEIKKNKDFVLAKDKFKVCATGNVMNNIDVPTRDRFNIVNIGGIDYGQLKTNLLYHRYGIDSQLVNSLNDEAYEELVNAIIKFVKNISDLQNQEILPQPNFGMKQVPYSQNELTSPSLNPRLITNIINQSETLNDISNKFSRSAERILGIDGLPDEEELGHIVRFQDAITTILEEDLSNIAKTYKIDFVKDKTKEDKFNELVKDIDEAIIKSDSITIKNNFGKLK